MLSIPFCIEVDKKEALVLDNPNQQLKEKFRKIRKSGFLIGALENTIHPGKLDIQDTEQSSDDSSDGSSIHSKDDDSDDSKITEENDRKKVIQKDED